MTGEEKFQVDLEGYLVIKNVLSDDEVAEMNDIIDNGDRQGPPSLWGEPFKRLIDHPKILPYLIDLLGAACPARSRLRPLHGERSRAWRIARR